MAKAAFLFILFLIIVASSFVSALPFPQNGGLNGGNEVGGGGQGGATGGNEGIDRGEEFKLIADALKNNLANN